MKLTIEEMQGLVNLMKKFHSIDSELTTLENRVTAIESEKKVIHANIAFLETQSKDIREEEEKFMDEIINKYGNVRINMETFEIEPS